MRELSLDDFRDFVTTSSWKQSVEWESSTTTVDRKRKKRDGYAPQWKDTFTSGTATLISRSGDVEIKCSRFFSYRNHIQSTLSFEVVNDDNFGYEVCGICVVDSENIKLEPRYLRNEMPLSLKNIPYDFLGLDQWCENEYNSCERLETFKIGADNRRNIKFSGKKLVEISTRTDTNYLSYWTLSVYSTGSGKYVCVAEYSTCSSWKDNIRRVCVVKKKEEIIGFFGYQELSIKLYEKLKIRYFDQFAM